jgi:phospholipid transport system transporter-binding protein
MNRLTIVTEGPGHFIIDGDLTFSSLDKKTVNSFAFLTSAKKIVIDLGGVGNTDSGGLALLVEWLKYARGRRVQLQYRNVPEQILNLAKLSGLDIFGHTATDVPPKQTLATNHG